MAVIDIRTGTGMNYIGSTYNSGGSHMVGWDSGAIRSEVYEFRTGSWPVTHIKWYGPKTDLYQGSDIALRYGISTSPTYYVNEYGEVSGSHPLSKNTNNEIDVNLAANTTYYFTVFPAESKSAGWGLLIIGDWDDPDENWWFTIHATQTDRTPCTAPTSLSLSRSIQTPNQNVTLSWSGASGGTNTSISSYNIYRSTSASGSYSYLGNTTSTSYNVAAPSAGSYYYYKIISVANVSGYNSGYSGASGGLKGNTAPGAPSVSQNKTVIPSTGGSVVFTVSAGSDPDGQSLSLYYATSSGGTKTAFTSPLTVNLTAAATYYFYTYDGLAYSSATSKSVSKNTKPSISSVTHNAIGSYSALGGNGTESYQLGYASSITPKITTNKTGTVTVELEYYASNATTTWSSSSVSRATMQTVKISSTSNVILNNSNIHQYISLGSTNIHWRLRLRMSDGIEYSDYVYYPASSGGKYYSVARPSSLLASYNQFANSNITGTIAGEIWRNVRLKIYNDTSATLASATATAGGVAVTATTATSVDGVYRYVDVTLPDGISSGASISVTVNMKDSGNSVTKATSASIKETKIPTLNTLSHGAASIKPFTDTGTFAISSVWPFGTYTTIDSTTLAAYNCSTTVSTAIKFIHSSSNSGSGANRVEKTPSVTWAKSGDNIAASFTKQTIYDWNNSLGITTYSGSRTYYCRIEITNLFGKVVATPWLSRTFNFAEPAQSPSITSIEWSNDATTWTTLQSTDSIQEGIYLRFNCTFGLFTTDEVKVSMLLTNTSGERSVGCYEFGSPTKITPITYSSSELSRASNRTVASNSKSYVYHITTEIADTTDRNWRLKIETTGGTVNSSYSTTSVTRQCSPDINFLSCVTDQSYNFTYEYSMTDNGGAGTLTTYLCDETDKAEITNALSGMSGTIQAKEGYRDWEVKTITVKAVSVVTGLRTNTKTYYFNAIIVYQISPTVAYRKNQLGINTDHPDSNSIIDIHQSTGREIILIRGLDDSTPPKATKFEVNPSTGVIKFYLDGTLKKTVDLLNGFLT